MLMGPRRKKAYCSAMRALPLSFEAKWFKVRALLTL